MSELKKLIHDLTEKVNKAKDDKNEKPNLEAMVKDILTKQKEEGEKNRKSVFVPDPTDEFPKMDLIQKRIITPAKNDADREIQRVNDDVYLAASILKVSPKSLRMYQQHMVDGSELKKAMATASGSEGEDWIPTGFSAELIDLVRVQMKVAALFRSFVMPTNPYKFPVVSSDATAYLQTEATADEAQKYRASTPTTTNLQFSAVKLAARSLFSEELTEDSIVPIMPFIRSQIVLALATAREQAVLNGQNTTQIDSNVTNAYDAKMAFDGLRYNTQSAAKVDISTFNIENIRSIRKAMGKYGLDPSQLALIVSLSAYLQLLSLKDSNSVQVVTTIDKYGPNATILSGEIGKIDGSPIIVSEQMGQNLNGSGVYDGVTTTKTIILYVYLPGYLIGERRRVTVKTDANIETGQEVVVATQRMDFKPLYTVASNYLTGLGYNLTA